MDIINANDTISRQGAINEMQAWIDALDKDSPAYHSMCVAFNRCIIELKRLPAEQSTGWLENHIEEILQAGCEGREIEFRIHGRLFAIREKAQ